MNRQHDRLDIHLLGGFSLAFGGDHLPPLPSRHARLLFAWLALQAGRPQSRTLLADRFWPDLPEARGRRRLSHALWQVQDSFGELRSRRSYLVTRGDEVAFDVEAPYWLDVEEFEQRIDEVDEVGTVDTAGMRHLRRVLQLYGGDLLAGSYEPWVLQEQERLRQRYVRALHRLTTACEQRGNFEEALAVARRLTHEAPLREDAHRSVMRLCVLVGQPSQALEQFERCRSVLAEELGATPSAETVELHDSIAHSRTTGPARAPAESALETRTLVGRNDERVRLVDQLERTLAGGFGSVFVEGEPGVGKTHLLVQAAEDARWRGCTVVWGSCEERRAPFSWLRDALLPVLDGVRVTQLATVTAPVWLHEASRLLPPLRDAAGAGAGTARPSLSGADGAERMRQAIAHVLTGLAAIDPLVVVLEDLHLADEDTFALLQTLARHPNPGRLLLALSFRDVEARSDDEVWASLRALDRDARPLRIALRPLSAFETGSLLGEALRTRHVPPRFVERVQRETGGNPLYVLELLRALRDRGELADDDHHLDTLDVPVTRGLRTLIDHRLALLGEDETAVAEQAAVLGSEFPLGVLASASQVPPRARTVALGELVRRNLLEIADGDVRFIHAATRTVLLEGLSDARARELHAAAARAIEAHAPDHAESLAAHLLVADPPRAVAPLRRAAERAIELHAYGRAAEHLTDAVEAAGAAPMAVEDRLDLLLSTESVLDVLGRRDEQAAVLVELSRIGTPDPAMAVELGIRRARHLGHVDRLAEAVDVARTAVAAAAGGDDLLRGRALTALGHVHGWRDDHELAVEVLEEAAALADDDPAAAADALNALGVSLRILLRFDEADDALLAARAAASRSGDEAAIADLLGASADVHAETGRTEEAASLHERAVAIARRIGYRYREGVSLVNLASIRLLRAEPGPALTAYDEAAEVFASLGNTRGGAMVLLNRAWLRHRWIGDDEAASHDANAARDHLESLGITSLSAVALETLAGVARRRGDHARSLALLDDALRVADAARDQRAEVELQRSRAELALDDGDPALALTVTGDALEQAQALDMGEFVADLASLGALAAARVGDRDAADRLAVVADEHVEMSSEPHRVHHRLGLVAADLGRQQEESQHHRTAGGLLQRALDGLDEVVRAQAAQSVPAHRMIADAASVHVPRTVELRLARVDAPRGRALSLDETVPVALELPPLPDDKNTRRTQLLALLSQVEQAGAQATVEDLSTALEVSASTVRRDLRALRAAGHEATTRGTGTG